MSGGGNKFRRGIMSNQMLKKSQLYNTSKYNLNDIQRVCERLEEIKRDITRRKDNAADQINVLNQTLSRDRLKLNDIKKVIKVMQLFLMFFVLFDMHSTNIVLSILAYIGRMSTVKRRN